VLKNVKILLSLIFIQCTYFFCVSQASAQEWEKVTSITHKSPIVTVSLDRYGLFYFADNSGNIFKYDTLGALLFTYSPLKKVDVTLLEAWRNVNIFVFYQSFQEYLILDRFLSQSPTTRINPNTIGFARLATYSYDNNIWIIDETEFSLVKYNLTFGKIDLSTPLDLILDSRTYDMNFIREYQSLVFLNDKNSGVLIFDNMGNYKTKIPVKGLSMVGFYNDEIYFQEGDSIKFINIYTYNERLEQLPELGNYKYVLYTKNNCYLFTTTTISVFKR